jgi:hypothetical protein
VGQLDGRTVLITGGNGGIGLAAGLACGAAGARIVVWGRNVAKNEHAIATLTDAGIDAHAFVCDVSSEPDVVQTFAASIDAVGGRIDSVIANAGRGGTGTPLVDTSLDAWREVMATNLDGVFLTVREGARHMVEAGGGAIVIVSSTSAIHGAARNEAYGTAKTALLGLTRAMAVAHARHRIRVNALLPGWTITDLASAGYASERFRSATISRTPVRRWADPSEMGPAAVYLADPTLTFHTGDTMVVDGGYTVF